MPSMQRSHTRYSAGSHHCIILDTVAPSRLCQKICFLTARSALTATTCCIMLAFGALSRGSDFPLLGAISLVEGQILSKMDPYFCGPGQNAGSSSALPSSANSSARSLIKHQVWLLTFTRVMLPVHSRSSIRRRQITSKCTI